MPSDDIDVDAGASGSGSDEPTPPPEPRHRIAKVVGIGLVVTVVLVFGSLLTGFPPLHLASASDLIAFRDRINAAAATPPSCPYGATPERTQPAEIDWIGRHIRLRHAKGQVGVLPGSLRYSAAEKQMLGPGPYLQSVGCPAIGDVRWRADLLELPPDRS